MSALAGVVLVLALLNPDRTVHTEARPMPDLATCERAVAAFVAPREPQFPPPFLNAPDGLVRWASCVTLPAPGQDA